MLRQSHRNAKLHINISNERQLAEKLLHWPPRIERQIERCKKPNGARQGGIQEAGGKGRKGETSTHTTRHTPGHTHTHTLTRMSAQKKSHLNADYNKGRAFCSWRQRVYALSCHFYVVFLLLFFFAFGFFDFRFGFLLAHCLLAFWQAKAHSHIAIVVVVAFNGRHMPGCLGHYQQRHLY